MRQSLKELIENRQHNQQYVAEIESGLRKHQLNVNYYIDGNHLKLFLDSMIRASNELHKEIFRVVGLGECPELPVNKAVYSELIRTAQINLQRNILRNLAAEFGQSLGVNLIDSYEIQLRLDSSRKLQSADEYFQNSRVKKLGWHENRPEILEQSAFMSFFLGGGVDFEFLINTLKKYWQREESESSRSRISEFIEDFKLRNTNPNPKTQTLKRQRQFSIFKDALRDFNSWSGLVSEVNEGETLFNIYPKANHLIEFHEKAVDTKLIMRCMDDLIASKDNDVFVFVTNDTDFLPLFERVLETKRQLIWLPGAERKSKRLEAVVGKKRTFDLSSFFLGTSDENPQVPTTNYWDKEIIEPICEDFAEIRHYYLHDKGYEVFMRKQQNDYEKFLRAQYEEFERRLDDDA